MLDLSTHKAPFDIALPYGLTVTVKPLTTAGMAAAQAAARRGLEAIERQARGARKQDWRWTDCLTSRPRGSATASTRHS